jgi:hypothetical protein
MVKEEEKERLLNSNYESNEALNYAYGSSLELLDQLMTQAIENGCIFVNRDFESSIETNLIQYSIEKYNLKRVLVIDWDTTHNLNIQQEFYDNSKLVKI